MFTNTFTPHIGGVSRSVSALVAGLRAEGHQVLVVAPEFPGDTPRQDQVIRISAFQNFGGSDFSVPIPISRTLAKKLDDFDPDIIHSHHPFLLGGTALRVSSTRNIPIVYTYHTRYDLYGHYVIKNSDITKRLALAISVGYAELCDTVIAPSKSMAEFLAPKIKTAPVVVIPTGVNTQQVDSTDTAEIRAEFGIPDDAFVVGHVGRLAEEKNLEFLTRALIQFLHGNTKAHAIIAGDGETANHMRQEFDHASLTGRVHMPGFMTGQKLARAYASMDVFAFTSISETQGLVLIEAMAAGVPVVALDANGVRDVVEDKTNGSLLPGDASIGSFVQGLNWVANCSASDIENLKANAAETAMQFSQTKTIQKTQALYSSLINAQPASSDIEHSTWITTKRRLAAHWNSIGNIASAVSDAVLWSEPPKGQS